MIRVAGLTKHYGDFCAVDDLSFDVPAGVVLGLVGPNGAGKTTTLRCIAGIIPPGGGRIVLGEHDLKENPVEAKRLVAFIPDEPKLFDYLTVEEHLRFVSRLYGGDGFARNGRSLLDELELGGKEKALPAELSRGMKQKLAIACGLVHDPRVILFDEPLTGLDPAGIRRMKQTIAARAASGCTVIVSSHLLALVEEICHRVLVVSAGKCVIHGSLAEILASLPEMSQNASLEEIFFRVTAPKSPPPPP